ncbi:MAG: class I SAM-dependent methyltransferase [Candidatus Eremiobacterota bacterium]
MDSVTQAVRSMYERYPYPTRAHGALADMHPGWMASLVAAPPGTPLTVLDAGCGTGMVALGTASCNPQARVTAADLNRTALDRLRREASDLKLENLTVVEADLATLEGLEPPERGWDVIYSSGVLHHMADPVAGLRHLGEVLSRDGVMRVMVYGTYGRGPLNRFVEAVDLLWPDRSRLEERLPLARRLMAEAGPDSPVKHPPWTDTADLDDVEFVDRYLNLHHRSYTVAELLEWVEQAGLEFLRWFDPPAWNLEDLLEGGALRGELREAPEPVKWQVVERLFQRPKLDFLAVRPGTPRRPPPKAERLAFLQVALNPQVTLSKRTRLAGSLPVWDNIEACLRDAHTLPLSQVELYALELASPGPVPAGELTERLKPLLGPDRARETLMRLLARELLYVPHRT